jgi:excinuclease ABC subunit A
VGNKRKDSNFVKIAEKTISEILEMTVEEMYFFFKEISLTEQESQIAKRILLEINNRLEYMMNVGLSYLTMNRIANTLSGGESQRINLTRTLGSNLTDSLYVLDEPSIGLHPRDTTKLIKVLKTLRDLGNTVLVVEHEEEIMKSSDFIVDMGPLAGSQGGEVVFAGDYTTIKKATKSLTADYLNHIKWW